MDNPISLVGGMSARHFRNAEPAVGSSVACALVDTAVAASSMN
jgi:hypothetical protein